MSEELQADAEPGLDHPRSVYDLFGHTAAERQIADAFESGHMHHAWMMTGPKGVGKSTLAYRLIRHALGAPSAGEGLQTDPESNICRQIEALSHPDFLLIRRTYNDKTKKLRGEISVDDARKAAGFFSHSASGQNWRVCLVDSADELNTNAANALLKTLEEPPRKGLLILIVHAPGRLLPTIRSRCRQLALRPPAIAETAKWLTSAHKIDEQEALNGAELAGGAPGHALSLIQSNMTALKPAIDKALDQLPRLESQQTLALSAQASKKGGEVVLDTVMHFLQRDAERRARACVQNDDDFEQAQHWVRAASRIQELAREQKAIYLDPKQSVLAAFDIMQSAAANR